MPTTYPQLRVPEGMVLVQPTYLHTFRTRLNPVPICHVPWLLVVLSRRMFR